MSAQPIELESGRARVWEGLVLLAILACAFVLRTRDIEASFIGPDDGNYLNSAQIQALSRGLDPVRWVREDVAWVRFLVLNNANENLVYPHSYAHQFVARCLYRLGCGALQSLRTSSAIVGTLTVLFAWWSVALFAARRRVGLMAAAIVALAPMHVFFSRTGWGQIGCACFYLAYAAILYRVLFVIPEEDTRAMRRAGWGMMAASILAFGWQEGVAPYIVGSGLVVACAPLLAPRDEGRRGWSARGLRSRRTWTYVWSAIPVGLATLSLALFSSFARKYWFNAQGRASIDSWWELKWVTSKNVVADQRLDLLLGWIVIVLALLGWFALRKHDRVLARYLVATAAAGSAILFLFFGDAWLVRAYLPAFVVVMILAAFGIEAILSRASARFGPAPGVTCAIALLATLAAVSWTTLFGALESPLFVQHFYNYGAKANLDHRHVDQPILDLLIAQRKPDERVAAFGDKAAIFRMQDAGISAREDYLEGARDTWPSWVIGTSAFEKSPFTIEHGGEYRRVASDAIQRWALYRRETP